MSGPGLTVHAGISGSGKTYGIRNAVWEHASDGTNATVIIDRMREWQHAPQSIAARAITVASLLGDKAPTTIEPGNFIVVRPKLGSEPEELERACELACATKTLVGIAVAEAHNAFPKAFSRKRGEGDDYWRSTVITEWRHKNVHVWADTQRLSRLSTDLCELATTVRLFAMGGKNDYAAAASLVSGGDELVEVLREAFRRYTTGDVGWHVELVQRFPPFTLRKHE